MNTRHVHALHSGELTVQKRRNTPNELTQKIPNFVDADMPQQHAEFYADLPYLPLATLDANGRPWVGLLVTREKDDPSIGIKVTERNRLLVVTDAVAYDPFVRALEHMKVDTPRGKTLFAGVGIDFSNRRRNKFAGTIDSVDIEPSGKIHLNLSSNQHLGNCPKYITVRSLEHYRRNAEILFDCLNRLMSDYPILVRS